MNTEQLAALKNLAQEKHYGRGKPHAEQVSKLCLRTYDELCRLNLVADSDNDRAILESASLLHDIGLPREPREPHNEAAFDLLAVEIPRILAGEPMSPAEFSAILYCVLWHRGKFGKRGDIEIADIPYTRKMAAILRVADALDRGLSQVVDDVSLELVGKDLTFWISSRSSAKIEITRAREKCDLMKQAFGLDSIHFEKK